MANRFKFHFVLVLILATIISTPSLAPAASPAGGYHLVKKVSLGGEGGWDYLLVDPVARRVYISRSTHVMVVDADNYSVVGDIPDTAGVHGIAIVPKLGRGFTSNGRAANATIFDLKALKPIGTVSTGKNPDAIIYDEASRRVFTFNGGSGDTTSIDAATGTVAGTIPLGGKPEFATADGRGEIFVNLEDKSEVVALDSRKLSVLAHWPLAPCEEPSGMAIDRKNHRLFIGCRNQMMAVMDATNGHVVTTLPIGRGVDANAFDPETGLAFSSNGDGTLTVVQEDSVDRFHVLENVTTERGARTMALDLKTHRVFLVTAEFGPPPAPTPEQPRPRPTLVPNSFHLMVMER